MKDTFTLLGSSRCEVLSVLDLKDAFHSLRLTENFKRYCGILPYFGSTSYLYQRMPMDSNISPVIWQSYINAILDCLQSRKYYETIMDDLLLFTPTKTSHFAKLEDLLKALCKALFFSVGFLICRSWVVHSFFGSISCVGHHAL